MSALDSKVIVALGREYGSGGHQIALLLAEKLGIPLYDKEMISLAGSQSGLSSPLLDLVDEHVMHVYIQASTAAAAALDTESPHLQTMSLNDQLHAAQVDLLTNLARQGSCIIVGRTADYVLRDDPDLISVFVRANLEARVQRIAQISSIPDDEALEQIQTMDAQRAAYYERYTSRHWGDLSHYDLTISSTVLGIDSTADQLEDFVRRVARRRAHL